PFIKRGKDTRSLSDSDDVYTITLERALQLLAEPKSAGFRRRAGSKVLADLGAHPDTGKPVRVLEGRYGPYASDGETNASIPRDADPAQVTLEQALALLAQKAAAPKRKPRTAKKTAAKRAAKRAGGAKKRTATKSPADGGRKKS
ncbi:MAG: topoisomerase C-terminal repeat-containing protein, partial [Dehalococcoidia bacterium]